MKESQGKRRQRCAGEGMAEQEGEQACAVVIPAYRENPTDAEQESLSETLRIFCRRPVYLLVPESMPADWYAKHYPALRIVRYPAEHFRGFSAYNRWMLSAGFYEGWLQRGFAWILICQLDVYVLSDKLEEFMSLPYAYWGGPMTRIHNGRPFLYGGNGGYSLRNLRSIIACLDMGADELAAWHGHEDEFFSYYGAKHPDVLPIPETELAARFAFDRFPRYLHSVTGVLPTGIHAYARNDPEYADYLISLAKEGGPSPFCPQKNRTKSLQEFLEQPGELYIYGAGEWGANLFAYTRRHGYAVKSFVISDGVGHAGSFREIPVIHASQLYEAAAVSDVKVLLGISTHYWDKKAREKFFDSLKKAKALFVPTFETMNVLWEEWLFELRGKS